MNAPTQELIKQHLIDPEICIRCNTCEETCPVDAVTHDGNNYVVDASICNHCMDCISPCPTGSIDNWRVVARPYSLDEQFSWNDLPVQDEAIADAGGGAAVEALEDDVSKLLEEARKGLGGKPVAPHSASKPTVNLYNRGKPAIATITGNYRLTDADRTPMSGISSLILASRRFRFWKARASALPCPGSMPAASRTIRGFIRWPVPATARSATPTIWR